MTALSSSSPRPDVAWPILPVAAAAIAVWVFTWTIRINDFGKYDLVAFWSAARVFVEGRNPYDAKLLYGIQKRAYPEAITVQPLWTPPWVMTAILPMALVPFNLLVKIWIILSGGLAFVSALLIRRFVEGVGKGQPDEDRPVLRVARWTCAVTYYPLMACLFYGQLGSIVLIGLAIFLYLEFGDRSKRRGSILGGLALSLTLVKPHLLWLLYLYAVLTGLRPAHRRTLLGFLLGFAALTLPPVLLRPDIVRLFLAADRTFVATVSSPSLGSWLQVLTGEYTFGMRVAPAAIIGIGFLAWWNLRRSCRPLSAYGVLLLVSVSVTAAPLSWIHDQILLLPIYFVVFAFLERHPDSHLCVRVGFPSALLVAHAALFAVGEQYFQHTTWYPILLIAMLVYIWKSENEEEVTPALRTSC